MSEKWDFKAALEEERRKVTQQWEETGVVGSQRRPTFAPPTDAAEPSPKRPTPKSDTSKGYAGLISARKKPSVSSTSDGARKRALRQERSYDEDSDSSSAERPAKRPFAPPKKPSRVSRPGCDEILPIDTRATSKPSEWYENIDMRAKYSRSDLQTVSYITSLIKECNRLMANGQHAESLPVKAKIRQRLHEMEFYDFLLDGVIIKKSKVLDENVGLPRIFREAEGVDYPWDIKADARMLYSKWMRGVLDPHLLRGIESARKKRSVGKTAISNRLQPNYEARASCNVVGENNLHNGQWWPLQICAMRDGAHGAIEAGIHGQDGRGAFSVILSSGGYDDVDEGDTILYCGTSGVDGKISVGTALLLETRRLEQPLRVLRSSALPQKNEFRPRKGLRYDGLYDIEGYEVIDPPTAMHRFTLRRRADQDPIRYQGVAMRPTDEQILEYGKIQKLLAPATT